jgi:hypothetical protein
MVGRQAGSDRPNRQGNHSVTQLNCEALVLHGGQCGLAGSVSVMGEEAERPESGPVTPAWGGGKGVQQGLVLVLQSG